MSRPRALRPPARAPFPRAALVAAATRFVAEGRASYGTADVDAAYAVLGAVRGRLGEDAAALEVTADPDGAVHFRVWPRALAGERRSKGGKG